MVPNRQNTTSHATYPQVGLEVEDVDGVKANQRDKEPHVRLGESLADEVAASVVDAGQTWRGTVNVPLNIECDTLNVRAYRLLARMASALSRCAKSWSKASS